MANYSIGGAYMVYSADGSFPDATIGNFGSGGDWVRVGSMIPCTPLGNYSEYVDKGAYISPNHPTPEDCVWAYMGAGGGEHFYIGIVAVYNSNLIVNVVPDNLSIRLYEEMNVNTNYYSATSFAQFPEMSLNYMYFMYSESTHSTYLCFSGQITGENIPAPYGAFVEWIASHSYTQGYGAGAVYGIKTKNGNNLEGEIVPEPSEGGGGDGSYDNDSDVIPFPSLPTLGAINSGFLTVYNPSLQELRSLADFLWSDAGSVWQNISQYQSSALDLISSLSVVPVAPPISGAIPLKIGGKTTGVQCSPLTSQYMTFDCGTFDLRPYYDSALDYGSYTKVSIMLPYCGIKELKTDEVMNATISVRYNIDLVTGNCVAIVSSIRTGQFGIDAPLYQFNGNMAMQIPLTGRDFASYYGQIIGGGLGVMSGIAQGNISGTVGSAMSIMMAKPQVQHAGTLSTNHGFLGSATPFLIIETPVQSYPMNANQFYGYPCNQTLLLGDLSGYTECEADILNISCTNDELDIIREKLKDGVIL